AGVTVTPGKLANGVGTSSRKNWTYFTSDLSAPDGNQPHNSVTQLGVGDTLKASLTFTMPNTITSNAASASRDFRWGFFFDPTDARVQADVNSDSGGGTAPWTDATGYGVLMPLNSNPANTTNAFQIAKRTTSNSSLFVDMTLAPKSNCAVTSNCEAETTLSEMTAVYDVF